MNDDYDDEYLDIILITFFSILAHLITKGLI